MQYNRVTNMKNNIKINELKKMKANKEASVIRKKGRGSKKIRRTFIFMSILLALVHYESGVFANGMPYSDGVELSSETESSGVGKFPGAPSAKLISEALRSVWPERQCEENVTESMEFTMISIACVGDYTVDSRKKILDIFFKSGLTLIKESYQLDKKSGLYLYKLEDKRDPYNYKFVKIYVRDSRILWPVHERLNPQIGIFVQNLDNYERLLEWQTLGVPLTYGIISGQPISSDLSKKVVEYKQELWLTLTLESNKPVDNNYRTLTLEDASDSEKLGNYMDKVFPKDAIITGVSSYQGSLFMKDIFSLRNLFAELRQRGVTYFLDSSADSEGSGGYDTARIMSLHAFRAEYNLSGSELEMQSIWDKSLAVAQKKGVVIITVDSNNPDALNFLKSLRDKYQDIVEFTFISELPLVQ